MNPAPRSPLRPPLLLVAVAIFSIIAGAVMGFYGAVTTGVSTDEPVHVERLRGYFKDGLYVLDEERKDHLHEMPRQAYVYAPVTMLALHGLTVAVGAEKPGSVSTDARAFHARHVGVVLIGLVGVAAAGALGAVVMRDRRWGLVAAGGLSALPMWTGSTMFNVKDTPVATGNTLMVLGLAMLIMSDPQKALTRWFAPALLAAGTFVMVGTRPGMWPAVLASTFAALAVLAIGRKLSRRIATSLGIAFAVAVAGLLAIDHRVFGRPVQLLINSIEATASYGQFEYESRRGRGLIPFLTIVEVPILMLLLATVGVITATATVVASLRKDPPLAAGLVAVEAQALTFPLVVITFGLDAGLRQLLFAAPAAAVLATFGLRWLYSRWEHPGQTAWSAIGALAIALPLVTQVTTFPYQYSNRNILADLLGAPENNDYWQTSVPELLDKAPTDHPYTCETGPGKYAIYPNHRCLFWWGWWSLRPEWREHGLANPPAVPPHTEFYAVARGYVPPNCQRVKEVTRWRNFRNVVMSRLLLCTTVPD
ncbi:hypothetical protein [Mycobacterium decipiens]|uniref:Glycosyltransferase RgtA/B/C/D-like domain-containing protein n=1 Tax=Mycobacterium decipiens TaxID=1430326 RepID=A0A1X2LP46_9MYCO|nr:hypothetical protein [Mycobacterium decipiens]OSC36776.1 hypothetical protein B8W66_22375 [Mycobacterium decipiens]